MSTTGHEVLVWNGAVERHSAAAAPIGSASGDSTPAEASPAGTTAQADGPEVTRVPDDVGALK